MTAKSSAPSVEIGAKALGDYVTESYALHLYLRNNELECCASIEVFDQDNSISPAELIKILQNHNIGSAVDLEQIAIFCSEAAQGENQVDFVLARGTKPEQGKDGWFEMIVETGDDKRDLVVDDLGRVDHKSLQTFTNIVAGQNLGKIHPPTDGKPGTTVTGKPIPAVSGKPAKVRMGSGASIDGEGSDVEDICVIAEKDGRAIYDNNVISVTEEMVISGDVDLKVGHIIFNGFVEIKGDVLDDFNITATKGLRVTGTVGACQIRSQGPVTIGSMVGKERGKVICKGGFNSRFVNQATIECWGDINIEHEIRHSVLKSTGKILCPKGMVFGGQTIALEGIEAKILGATAGTKTHVTAGVYFPEADRLQFLRTRVKSVTAQSRKISETLRGLNQKPVDKLRKAMREAIELRIGILTQRHVNLETEQEKLTEELNNFKTSEHKTANPKINVMGLLREKVIITLGEVSEETNFERSGPLSVIENNTSNGLRYLSYSPLLVSASELNQDEGNPGEEAAETTDSPWGA